jgi:hypothetical protein
VSAITARVWTWHGVRGWLALAILAVLLADLALTSSGVVVLCKQCGDRTLHSVLVVLGGAAWFGVWRFGPRLGATPTALVVGALAGAHVALAVYLVSLPRWCSTCVVVSSLAVCAFACVCAERESRRAAAVACLTSFCAVTAATVLLGG